MKRFVLDGVLLSTAAISIANAADIPAPVYKAPVPVAAAVASWTGFYVGGQIAGSAVKTSARGDDPNPHDANPRFFFFLSDPSGPWGPLSFPMTQVSAGAFAGYDYQIGRVVLGIEGDYNRSFGSNHSHITEDLYPGPGGIWSSRSDWNASLRGRLGLLATERALFYGTAGIAFAKFELHGGIEVSPGSSYYQLNPNFGPGDIGGGTRVGWTAGAGFQYALDRNWSVRSEYRYTDYGTKRLDYTPRLALALPAYVDSKITENRVSLGLSYKFADSGSAYAAVRNAMAGPVYRAPATAANWTGVYVGGQLGANAVATNVSGNDPQGGFGGGDNDGPWGPLSFPMTQVSAGLFAGYDHQIGRVVVGVEGDYNRVFGSNHSNISEDLYPGPGGIWHIDASWNASLRARAGFLATERALVYGTAGLALAKFNIRGGSEVTDDDYYETHPNFGPGEIGGGLRLGWTVGAGIQYALDRNWSLRGEYRYTDYGTKRFDYAPALGASLPAYVDSRITEDRVSIGASYKFNGNAGPFAGPVYKAPALAANWTGVYVGGQLGANAVTTKVSGNDPQGGDNDGPWGPLWFPMTQMSAGLFGGYDHQIGRWVVGFEGDYNRLFGAPSEQRLAADQYPGPGGIWKVRSDWNASIRARLGYLVTDSALIYATAGVAFARFDVRGGTENSNSAAFYENNPNFGPGDIGGGTRAGFTVGGGVQYALDSSWSMRGEYRYTDYGTKRLDYTPNIGLFLPAYVDTKVTENRVGMGVSYKFGWPALVVAKY